MVGSSQCKVTCLDYVVVDWAFIVSLAQFNPYVERISTIEVNSVPVSLLNSCNKHINCSSIQKNP